MTAPACYCPNSQNSTFIYKELLGYEWYHGPISRQSGVAMLKEEGDFLVRDCISRPGEYVLSVNHENKVLHFKINQRSSSEEEKNGANTIAVLYQFENEFFPSIPELIMHHVISKQPISISSHAIISRPVKSTLYLNHLAGSNTVPPAATAGGSIYAKLQSCSSDRSQSSMSGDTVSSNGSTNLIKSGSRASLLKENCKENGGSSSHSPPSRQGELKRFKSLPGGKKVRRVKRRAPSPPKNQKPYQGGNDNNANRTATTTTITTSTDETPMNHNNDPPHQPNAQLSLDLESSYNHYSAETSTHRPDPALTSDGLLKLTSSSNDMDMTRKKTSSSSFMGASFMEGVKLRRKRFSHLLQKPRLNLSQRQSMHVAAYLRKANNNDNIFLKEDKRRYSMPRLLDDYDDEQDLASSSAPLIIINQSLVRSPSDSSLLYLSQLGLTSTATAASCHSRISGATTTSVPNKNQEEPPLPSKKRQRGCSTSTLQMPYRNNISKISLQDDTEALYDCLPKPRSCLTEEQIRFNEIYDIPRRLAVPPRDNSSIIINDCFEDPRSISAFGLHRGHHRRKQQQPSDCISLRSMQCRKSHGNSSSTSSSQNETKILSRHRNYTEGLDGEDIEERPIRPALPPKSRNGTTRKRSENELYANPRSLIGSTERPIGEDCISLCSNFSYFSECTNASTGVPEDETLSSFSSERLADMTPFRFSPTSFISDTMSLPDFDDDAGQSSSSFAYLELQRDVGNEESCLRHGSAQYDNTVGISSTLSSVSSITLQGDDISLGYDSTSLPEDPFPQGLPTSSASSTIGSPPPSAPSESENEDDGDAGELGHGNFGDDLQSLPRDDDDEDDLPAAANEEETDSMSSSHRVSSSSTTPTTTTTTQVALEPTEKISSPDDDDVLIKFATPFKHQISNDSEPEFEEKSQHVEYSTPDSSIKELKKNLSVDIFNHRSASRGCMVGKSSEIDSKDPFEDVFAPATRCKSQPLLDVDESPIWREIQVQNGGGSSRRMRKSLSPNILQQPQQQKKKTPSATVNHGHEKFDNDDDMMVSVFDPTGFQSLFLPVSSGKVNKPLDPMALSSVHRTLIDTPAPLLALHLTQVDLDLFGLGSPPPPSSLTTSCAANSTTGSLKKLTIPNQFHIDIIDRYICLRTFVEVTVLAASNIGASAKVVAQWVRVAQETRKRLRNYFGFYAIASGIVDSPHLKCWTQLWSRMEKTHPDEWNLLNGPFKHKMQMMATSNDLNGQASLPHLIPLVVTIVAGKPNNQKQSKVVNELLVGSSSTNASTGTAANNLCCDVALYDIHHKQAQLLASMSDVYQKNAELAFRHITNFEDLLLDLFRTEFHVKLLWGNNGIQNYPSNFDERHTKFSKVLSALASICSRQQ